MECPNVLLDIERYSDLILAEKKLEYLENIIFNENNFLSSNKKSILFCIDEHKVELLYPNRYKSQLNDLQKNIETSEGKNV